MSFDKFLLAVESRDLSQAGKSIIWVSSFPSWVMGSRTLNYTKKTIWHLAIWQNWCFGQFYHSKICNIEKFTFFSVFLVKGKSERIERINFTESSGLSCWETEKKFCYPSLSFVKEDTLIGILSGWHRSRNSTAKRNLSVDI